MTGLKLRIASLAVALGVLTATPVQPALAEKSPTKPSPSAKSERPTTRTKDCLSGGCHSDTQDHKILHGPTAVGACRMCHAYDDVKKHTFKSKRPNEKLCDFCHIGHTSGEVIHKPVQEGQCLECHDPHGGTNKQLLRADDLQSLCKKCHDDVTRGQRYMHGPVGTGSCAACHDSHASRYPKLLSAPARELCIGCHKQMGEELKEVRFVHEPVRGDCLQCHEAHASNSPMHLKDEPAKLCLSCHEHDNIKKLVESSPRKHSVVTEGKACSNCHNPHGSDMTNLMNDKSAGACLSCHDTEIETDDNRKVAAVVDLNNPDLNKHGPVRDGTCNGCHDVHGGKVARLLNEQYPEDFYQSFKTEKYALCFRCHSPQLVRTPKTDTLTRFRNGKKNLHYLHVNKEKRGRSCRACHSTHASTNTLHVRESLPYGKWEMPINFKLTRTGGSCASGCHRELAYDRKEPIDYEAISPAASEDQPNARTTSPRQKPIRVIDLAGVAKNPSKGTQ